MTSPTDMNPAQAAALWSGLLILLYHLELPVMAIHALGVTLLAARLIQAIGLATSKSTSSRMAAMALTLIALFACGGILVVHALV